jgi:hypothetical protein
LVKAQSPLVDEATEAASAWHLAVPESQGSLLSDSASFGF